MVCPAACSPEARGRSERAFGTLRDRLVKEPALAGIETVEDANRFIADTCLPDRNRRFATPPELEDGAFVPLVRPDRIDDMLCIQTERTVTIFPSNRVRIVVATKPVDFRRYAESAAALRQIHIFKNGLGPL